MQSLTDLDKKPYIVLISGKARSGKDTIAEMIRQEYERKNVSVLIIHYADYLKYICKQFYGWNGEKDEIGRSLLQKVGEDFRKKDPLFWVNSVIDFIDIVADQYDVVLIPDVRYLNEIAEFDETDYGKITVRMSRKEDNGLTKKQSKHLSETSLDNYDFDVFVGNNGTLAELREKAKRIVEEIEIRRNGYPIVL